MPSSDNDLYVVEQRQVRRDWEVVSERQFTGNPDDAETGMAPRQLDQCWEYMGHRQGRRRVVPAYREEPGSHPLIISQMVVRERRPRSDSADASAPQLLAQRLRDEVHHRHLALDAEDLDRVK